VALAALQIAADRFPELTADTIAQGMSEVAWPGRLQIVHQAPDTPTVLADCAHNEESAAMLAHALTQDYHYRRLWLIFGVSADKDVAEMMGHLFPLADHAIVAVSSHRRAAAPEWLAETAAALGFAVETADTVAAALTAAWQAGKPGDLICVTGSIFMVGDLLNQWEALQSQWRLSQDERPDMEEHNRDE
jgi:dihydrofolate synthase/folylpolyglutamate synthase